MASQETPNKTHSMFPIGVFAFAQCANYTVEEYIATLCREQHRSREEIEGMFDEFGGVEGLLKFAREEKARYETVRRDQNTIVLGSGPQATERVEIAHFAGWGIAMRVWGFEKLAQLQAFFFDFVNQEGQHINTPAGMAITALNYSPGTPVYSIQTSMAKSFPGNLGQTITNAPEEVMGQESYIIIEGTLLKIHYQNTDVQVQIPVHNVAPYTVPGIPVATFSTPRYGPYGLPSV